MSAFEVKSEGSRRGRKYGNLLDESKSADSAKDFKRGEPLIKGNRASNAKKGVLNPLKSEKRKPNKGTKEKEQDDKSVKSKGSSYSFALSNKSVLSARILKT